MDLTQLTTEMHRFVESRGWYRPDSLKPQTPRNLAASLVLEATEVLELFQWTEEASSQSALGGELADVTLYVLQLASVAGIDLEAAVLDKLKANYDRAW